jgi:hypothetical protein
VAVVLLAPSCSSDAPEEETPDGQRVAALTGGGGLFLAGAAGAGGAVLPAGWVEEELAVSGFATTYTSEGDLPTDGRWDLGTEFEEPFTTRVVVRRPPAADFNGTVLVEWLNVSGGFDAAPDYTYLAAEILRGGYAWVGVSAQYVGIEGGPVAVSTPGSAAAGAGKGLRALDPERYGGLDHPGDAFAYDIYTQAADLARSGDLLDDLRPVRLLAVGESQSGFMLTTYANGVQPLTDTFDGFLIHSRGGATAPLGVFDRGIDIAGTLTGPPTVVRDDLDAPVLTLQSESDVVGVLNYLPARQPDSDVFRLWEVAGARARRSVPARAARRRPRVPGAGQRRAAAPGRQGGAACVGLLGPRRCRPACRGPARRRGWCLRAGPRRHRARRGPHAARRRAGRRAVG